MLSVGCGWHPGRHLFPSPAFWMLGVDRDPAKVAAARASGSVDEARVGRAGALGLGERYFDVVLYRQVLHHVAHDQPLAPCFAEAARLLAPGGAMVVVEPGLWHPVGAALSAANRAGLGPLVHGTPDDVPLSPRRLEKQALAAGLEPELHAVTYTWRRMPPLLQRALWGLDGLGSRPRLRAFGHTLMLIAPPQLRARITVSEDHALLPANPPHPRAGRAGLAGGSALGAWRDLDGVDLPRRRSAAQQRSRGRARGARRDAGPRGRHGPPALRMGADRARAREHQAPRRLRSP